MNGFFLLSKYRSALMGIAMLWVMYFHSPVMTTSHLGWFFHRIGFYGVDIFLFLSAFGLYFAMKKYKSAAKFYRSRLLRIFPAFLVVAIAWFFYKDIALISPAPVKDFIGYITTAGYWLEWKYFEWYIPTLVLLYALTPLLYYFFEKFSNSRVGFCIACMAVSPVLAHLAIHVFDDTRLMGSIVRLPVFILGMLFGYYAYNKKEFKREYYVAAAALLFVGAFAAYICNTRYTDVITQSGLNCYPAFIIAPCACILISGLFGLTEKLPGAVSKVLSSPFAVVGTYSLEIYLVHERLQMLLAAEYPVESQLVIAIAAVALAILLHEVIEAVEKILKCFAKKVALCVRKKKTA